MEINPRENVPDFSLPLPLYTSVHVADASDHEGGKYAVFMGLEKEHAQHIKKLSLDESDVELQNNTGDRKRFGEGSYEEWYAKNRTPFILVHRQTNAIAALVWFGPKSLGKKSIKFGSEEKDEIQNNWHTVVWRSYPPFRGRGLMRTFTQFVMSVYEKQFSEIKFWEGMDNRNEAMIALSSKLGFKPSEENSDPKANWLVVVKE